MRRFYKDYEVENNPRDPNLGMQRLAADYCESKGFPSPQPTPYAKVDQDVCREVADIFERTPNSPSNPSVRKAYKALVKEVEDQYAILPFKIEPFGDDFVPYKNSQELMDDARKGHMWVYAGGEDHAILTREQNFKFRAVHDAFSHVAYGLEFGQRGEFNAWIEHSKMFSPLARAALTSETRAQNSWVTCYGDHPDLPPDKRPYAEQKAILLPPQYWTCPELDRAYADHPGFYYSPKEELAMQNPPRKKPAMDTLIYMGPKSKPITFRDTAEWRAKIDQFVEAGLGYENWYEDTLYNIQALFDGDERKALLFCDLLAATSPRSDIRENVYRALTVLTAINEGYLCRLTIGFEAHFNNILRSLLGLPLSGQKVRSFQANLLGDPNAVTVDTWMMRAFDFDHENPTAREYQLVGDKIRSMAKEYRLSPAQAQSAMWVGIKKMLGDPADTAEPFEVTLKRTFDLLASQSVMNFDRVVDNLENEENELQIVYGDVEGDPFIDDPGARENPGRPKPKYPGKTISQRLPNLAKVETNGIVTRDTLDYICSLPPAKQLNAFIYIREHIDEYMRDGTHNMTPAMIKHWCKECN